MLKEHKKQKFKAGKNNNREKKRKQWSRVMAKK